MFVRLHGMFRRSKMPESAIETLGEQFPSLSRLPIDADIEAYLAARSVPFCEISIRMTKKTAAAMDEKIKSWTTAVLLNAIVSRNGEFNISNRKFR
jgi:hypothetical protein